MTCFFSIAVLKCSRPAEKCTWLYAMAREALHVTARWENGITAGRRSPWQPRLASFSAKSVLSILTEIKVTNALVTGKMQVLSWEVSASILLKMFKSCSLILQVKFIWIYHRWQTMSSSHSSLTYTLPCAHTLEISLSTKIHFNVIYTTQPAIIAHCFSHYSLSVWCWFTACIKEYCMLVSSSVGVRIKVFM